ncbi:MAG: ion transporter, partial [Chloroflexota bacterium]|nr:ion transporter [Chloroflexota bacterium]
MASFATLMDKIFMKLKSIIEEDDTMAGKVFDFFIQFVIVLSLLSFSIETLPDLSDKTTGILRIIEIVTVAIFTVEYLLRLFVADKKLSFVFSFYGLIDIAAILPFYISRELNDLYDKGVVFPRNFQTREGYRFARNVMQLHDASQS